MYIGFMACILPKAKIIHCRRNPVDTCLSCYKQNFARGQYWSYNLEEMADAYERYTSLMEYWREILPGRFMEIDYEETVNNFEDSARKLIDFAGLEWDEACLEPHKQKRSVLTASKAQVTKPVYKTSVDKWKRYEKELQPLVTKLQGYGLL
ncbi:MAG: sulfotransferase [Alphaproteobacteria bacterium]